MANLLWIDVETTGLNDNAAIIEIALVPYIDGEIKPHFHSYIRPHDKATLDPKAFEINKIDIKKIWEFPEAKEVVQNIMDFVDSHECIFSLSGHNIQFDRKKLYTLFCRNSEYGGFLNRFRPGGICTLDLAKRVFKGKRKKPDGNSLGKLCDFFEIRMGTSHSALPDIMATIEVYEALLSRLSVIQVEEVKSLKYKDMKRTYMDNMRYVQRNPDGDVYIPAETMTNDVIRRFIFSELDTIYENNGHKDLIASPDDLTTGE